MFSLIIRHMAIAALIELGMSAGLENCRSGACVAQLEKASRRVLHIEWKPISIFPEEAKHFR